MKKLITAAAGVVLAVGLTARTASAGSRTAAFLLDTRADILAEILPEGSVGYSLEADDPTLTVTFNESVTDAHFVLPYGMGPLAFEPNGKTISGTNGVDGTATTAGGNGGSVFQIGEETTIKISGVSGSISGGKGGNGNPAGKGAFAFVDASGEEVTFSDPCGLARKGEDGRAIYVVTLDANGGTGGTPSVTATCGEAMPAIIPPVKAEYNKFLGYFDADGKQYYNADGTSAANWDKTEAATLCAQWAPIAEPDAVQLWKDGPYFATCNLGAEEPEEYGWYFWWGDTVGYKRNAASNAWVSVNDNVTTITFDNSTPANTLYSKEGSALSDYLDGKGNLKPEYDAATAKLGESWRMMTDDELQKLVDAAVCKHEWKENYNGTGVNGYLITGVTEGYTGKSIFLPAAGFGESASFVDPGSRGYYRTSTPNTDKAGRTWYLFSFGMDYFARSGDCYRYHGCSIRPVRDTPSAVVVPVGGDVNVKVDADWLEKKGLTGKTVEEIAEAMNATDTATGMKVWQAYVLNDTTAKPAFTGAAKSETAGKVTLAVPSYTANGRSGVTVSRKLVTKVGEDVSETALALDAAAVEVDEGDVSAANPVALYTTVIAFANANGAEVKSENTVGLMYVATDAEKAIVAVPWERIGGGAISAADLIDTRDLADGDLLHVYDKAQGLYRTWRLAGGAWSPLGTYAIEAGKVSESSAGDPGEATISRGNGVWLERGSTAKPFHLIGQYNAAKVALPGEAGWNLCGNAGIGAAAVADLGAADGDIIIVPTAAEPIRYTKRDGSWGRYVETAKDVGGRTVKTSAWTDGGTIGAGQGFWLVK